MNEELEKKEWAKPEMVDLDVRETASSPLAKLSEDQTYYSS